MSSRRLMNRSRSSDGRSYFSGSDMGSQTRSAGCRSYLSSVRSESRSTLCSVMAQITEDIQPTFESTLKSKSVSEEANVKFSCVVSGHPVPDVTWYKDDIQLDRYCGLPKYEISRDDKTHTLQIYNCTLDDAAIYQASAQNSRGIVSCSGVLEVGTMSEYKIHQNYFAKLKMRNENRRREQEGLNTGKENIPAASEPVKMSSPERAQRKRRSPMESSRRAGSPSEERATEVDVLSQTPSVEDRLAAPDQVSAAAAVQSISNAETITQKETEVLTYIHDAVDNASSKVLKKAKILTATTERSKENRTTGRREETMNKSGASIEKMEVQHTDAQMDLKTNKKQPEIDECMMTECSNKMDITDAKTNEKLSIKVNTSALEELKRGAQTATESRNKMDITDRKKNDKQSIIFNKSVSEELKRTQFASLTKTRNKMDITDTRKSEKQLVNVNKSTSRESKRDQSVEASVTGYGKKMDLKDTKSASEDSKRTQGPKMASVTESRNKLDTKTNEKTSLKTNKSTLEESTINQEGQMDSVAESRNKMDIIDTKKREKELVNVNKSTSRESKRDQSAEASITNYGKKMDVKDIKSASEDSKRTQGPKMASVTESRNKLDAKTNEKMSLKTSKSTLEESTINQEVQMASVAESRNKMDIIDTNKREKQSTNANKSFSVDPKTASSAQITSVTESSNKINITNEKTSLKTNKSTLEDIKIKQDVQMASVAESRNKMDIIDAKKREKQYMNANKSVSVESNTAASAQIASVTESSHKINIKDTKTKTEKQPVKANKSGLEESKINQSAQTASLTEYRNKMGIRDTRKTEKQSVNINKSVSEESNKVQGAQITSVTESKTKVDKQSETLKESDSELTKAQKPIAQKQLPLSVSMTTQTNKVVESTTLTKPSGKGTAKFEAPDTIQNCNPSFIDNKLKDFDEHRNSNSEDTCVRILPNSCGGNDVNVDTGERNASAHSLRGLVAADTHTKPTEPPTREDIPPIHKEVALELKEQPTLMHEVTVSIMETLSSCHLASQEQKLSAGDQSVASTKRNTLVTGPQNTEPSEKISPGHVSHKLQAGQVTTAMSSSLGDDLLSNMCEKDSKAEIQLIKVSDKPKSETKPASMSLKNMEENEMKNISTDVLHTTSEEKLTENSQHSKNQATFTEFVQICISNSDMVKPQSINGSSVSDVQMKDTNAQEFQITSAEAAEYVSKKGQEQSKVTKSEVPISTYLDMQSHSDGSGLSTFLPQHSKAPPTEFTIPAIYITDVDNTQNSSEKTHTANNFEIRNEPNPATSNVRNNNTVNHVNDTSDSTDITNRATAVKSESLNDVKFNLSLHSKSSEFNSQENVEASMKHHNSESFVKQLKEAALDLGTSNQPSINLNDASNMNFKDNVENVEKANSYSNACKETVKTTDEQVFSSTAANSDLSTRTDQMTTFPNTRTENSEIGVAVCLEKASRETYQGDTLSLKTQRPSQSVDNSPLMTSLETNSPRLSRRTVTIDPPKPAGNENIKPKSTEKDKENQFKVPQVIRKIRPEVFDASGHLKLWCQFFNIVSDSTIRWYKDEVEISEINRSAGDETQLCLAIIQMSKRDCGVYRCTIANEYGKDSTEYLLSTEFLSNLFLREELHEVGQEIEMTPLIFSKGLADPGCWGSKFYGRVTTEEAQVGLGCEHKTKRLKVIYGLDPVFESGSSCFMKVRSPIVYESREETVLAERNLQNTKQDCRIQNMAREYFKIFATEIRMIESFGAALEVIPLYFTYWPASSVPYATVEAELKGVYLRYCGLDRSGSLVLNEKSEVGQKCSALQHWIHQWTNGNVLFSRLEGVDTILTNIGIAIRSKGYQGFPCEANPKVFDQFQIQHQCNYFCGLLNLKPLKAPETLQTPARSKGSSSPLLQRRAAPGSSSPQTPRKSTKSPKVSRKLNPQTT